MNGQRKYFNYLYFIGMFVVGSVIGIQKLMGNDLGILEQTTESRLEIKQDEMEEGNIRVLILSTGYKFPVHPIVQLSAPQGIRVILGSKTEVWDTKEILEIKPDDSRFAEGSIRLEAIGNENEICVENIERGYGKPTYSGSIELRDTAEGIVIINELPVEDYLCKVVPSEMPANYELEALKAQAVCARSYAFRQMQDYGYPEYEAHVDDSTKFQVYNNSKEQETSSQAVKETKGEEVWYNGNVATTYYYSTSCGKTTDISAWGSEINEENEYLQSIDVGTQDGDYEKDLPWYAWRAVVPTELLSDLIGLNTGEDIGRIQEVNVTKRGAGDVVLQLVVCGDEGNVTIDTENKIRSALGGMGYVISKNDGSCVESTELLPSAFFTIQEEKESYIIEGGGLGHGIGMSQNGANEMAKAGMNYKEILQTFYQNVMIE